MSRISYDVITYFKRCGWRINDTLLRFLSSDLYILQLYRETLAWNYLADDIELVSMKSDEPEPDTWTEFKFIKITIPVVNQERGLLMTWPPITQSQTISICI